MGDLKYRLYGVTDLAAFWRLRQKAIAARSPLSKAWYRIRYYRTTERRGASIPLSAEFDGMPVFPHGLNGILISTGAKIGKNCVIFHQVTIGSNTLPGSRGAGAPVLGDNVYIGCGAKIIGNVTVGDNVRIGANCVVTSDVPANATVVSAPVRVIPHDEPQDNTWSGDVPKRA